MRILLLSTIFILSILLSACSSNVDKSGPLYYSEIPLEVNTIIPEHLLLSQESTIEILLTQAGENVTDADFVHFEIIKQDGNTNYGMSEAKNKGNGIYSQQVVFDSDGLYFLKIHVGKNGSMIMPTRQIIVGTLTENDKSFLQQNIPVPETNHKGHH